MSGSSERSSRKQELSLLGWSLDLQGLAEQEKVLRSWWNARAREGTGQTGEKGATGEGWREMGKADRTRLGVTSWPRGMKRGPGVSAGAHEWMVELSRRKGHSERNRFYREEGRD